MGHQAGVKLVSSRGEAGVKVHRLAWSATACSCRVTTATVCPASRSSNVSPQHAVVKRRTVKPEGTIESDSSHCGFKR
jgi:hypothetical protein